MNKFEQERRDEDRTKMICPACGDTTRRYGISWVCNDAPCDCSGNHAFVGVKKTPEWWSEDIKVYLDGDMWCAVRDDFANLQESLAGFGKKPYLAVEELKKEELNKLTK